MFPGVQKVYTAWGSWGSSSGPDCHSAQYWPGWRTLYQWSSGTRLCTESTTVTARSTSVRPEWSTKSLHERGTGEVCSSWTCMEGPACHLVGWDHSGGHGQTSQWTAAQESITPVEECFNSDTGLELPGCWVATLRKQEGRTNRTPTDGSPVNPANSGDSEWCDVGP